MRFLVMLLILLLAAPAHAQTVTPTPPADAYVMAMNARLRLREAPSGDAPVLRELDPRTPLSLIGRSGGGEWLLVTLADGLSGWVRGEYVELHVDSGQVALIADERALVYGQYLAPAVIENIRRVYADGLARGNRPDVFAKVGDSLTASRSMFYALGSGVFHLGAHTDLEPVIRYYLEAQLDGGNPFTRDSLAAGVGWTAGSLLSVRVGAARGCLAGETPLLCEYRLIRPTVALIMIGTNDSGYIPSGEYEANVERIIKGTLDQGVIPVISTLPDHNGYEFQIARYNDILTAAAGRYAVPLWDFAAVARTLPNRGLTFDGVHLSIGPRGEETGADFRPENLVYGYVQRNLTGLKMLDAVKRAVGW